MNKINTCDILLSLNDGRFEDALQIIKQHKEHGLKLDSVWETIPLLCRQLDQNTIEAKADSVENCLKMALMICDPKEVLLVLNGEIYEATDLKGFLVILKYCAHALLLLKQSHARQLSSICEDAVTWLERQCLSSRTSDERDYDADWFREKYENMLDGVSLYTSIVLPELKRHRYADIENFLCEIELSTSKWRTYDIASGRFVLGRFLLCVLEEANELLLSINDTVFGVTRQKVLNITNFIFEMIPLNKMINFFAWQTDHDTCEGTFYNQNGFILLLYLVYKCGFRAQLPCVYRGDCLLLMAIPPMCRLLKNSPKRFDELMLDFLHFLLSLVKEGLFNESHSHHQKLAMSLQYTMVWNSNPNMRTRAKELFESFLEKFQPELQHHLLRTVFTSCKHSGMRAFCVNLLHTAIIKQFPDGPLMKEIPILALLFIDFKVGETHLLQEHERIMAGLNFVRFWLLKDRTKQTKIWLVLDEIEKHLSTIQQCIEVSCRQFTSILTRGSKESDELKDTLGILSSSFPAMPKDEQKQTVGVARNMMDMMASIVARIHDIIRGQY